MARHELLHEVRPDGCLVRLQKGRTLFGGGGEVPFEAWSDQDHPGVSLLRLMVSNEVASNSGTGVLLRHEQVAELAPAEAQSLRLPLPCPYALRLESNGAFSDEQFALRVTWITQNGTALSGVHRTGAIIETSVDSFRIRGPLYSLIEEVDRLNTLDATVGTDKSKQLDARMVQLGRVKRSLADATGDASADPYLAGITISQATGIGVDAAGSTDSLYFKPTLYGDVPPPPGAEDNEDIAPEHQPLLPGDQAQAFADRLFARNGAWSHYRLGDGAYVVLDEPVVAALRVLQRINAGDAETRRRFRRDPSSFLLPEIQAAGGTGDVMCGGTALAADEAAGYGSRVLGVATWDGKAFSFKIPVNQQWFPSETGDGGEVLTTIDVPGADDPLVVSRAQLEAVISKVQRATAAGDATFTYDGKTFPLRQPDELLQTLQGLLGTLGPDGPAGTSPEPKVPRKRLVLRAAENEEDLKYLAQLRDPQGKLPDDQDGDVPGLQSTLDPHQRDAVGWLKACFISGMPGALLADDMGLGKTFEVVAFLYWLRLNQATDGRPFLVVAPAKLLEEWKEQIAIHLPPMAFGRPVYAYERGLRDITVEGGQETEFGRATLDVERLTQADWVLTTYETLRDHQFSFGMVRFRIAIFDEAQKIKSGTSMLNHAAKTQQPDFVILMTGTPVENSTMDIWTLLDVAWPGFLGVSGKDFIGQYSNGTDDELMGNLKERLISQTSWGEGAAIRTTPPVMLRRFKADILLGLPPKMERRWDEEMPPSQAKAYDAVLAAMQAGRQKPLAALQSLRQVCLHPEMRAARDAADRKSLINSSARFRALFQILKEAKDQNRGVLVFVDIRKAQDMLQVMIRDELALPQTPEVINGNTSPAAVADIKTRFQAGSGFGVLLLGPRSAGFGLTLTRATQVVHLNRWWNPAVEDQCSDRTHRKGQKLDVTVHLPIARHPRLGNESFDLILDGLLDFKREQSRRVIVPSSMNENELAEFFARLTRGVAEVGRETLDNLDRKDWRSFETWVASRFQVAGWQVNDTPTSGDGGADVICRHPHGGRPVFIQVKHRQMGLGSVDESAVRQVASAPSRYRRFTWFNEPMLLAVSNGTFELRARTLASQLRVRLVDRVEITNLEPLARDLLTREP
jgi:SNF2-related domain/Restriction endonuclease/Helicase conserved C-terminal domain